jgi:regulator of protease activity HflC (stomatin/prohibitin superfamily)
MTGKPVSGPKKPTARVVTLVIIVIIAVLFIGLMILSWRNIRPGYVGIVFDKATHQVTTGALEPGWAFINPFTQAIQEYPVTIQTYAMVQRTGEGSAADDDSIKVQSNEGQQLNLDVFVQYQVKDDEAAALYQDWGGADILFIEDRVVRQYTRSEVRDVASLYSWEEITSGKRGEITDKIVEALREEFANRHLDLVSFGFRGVHLPQSLQTALDRKIEAQQQAERQQYELEQARIRAEQDKVEAEGRAEAAKAQAEGEAEAIRIRAKAQSEANRILAESLTPELIQYREIDRWDGRLPLFSSRGSDSDAPPLMIDATSLITE